MTAPPRRPRALVAVGLVLLLLVPPVAAAGLWLWQRDVYATERDQRAEERAVLVAAAEGTTAWASVDYTDVDAYFARVQEVATGDFLAEFQDSEASLRSLLVENESVQVPVIPKGGVGLLERTGDSARVLVAMDATVTNKNTETPQPRQYRLQLVLDRVEGEWLISTLEFVS